MSRGMQVFRKEKKIYIYITEQPAELGTDFEREHRKGLAVGLVVQVGVAEEARAPLGRARCKRHTLQR